MPSKEKLFHFAGVSSKSTIVMECEHSDKVIGDQCSMSGIKNRVFHFAEDDDDDNEEEEEEGDAGTIDGYNDEGESRGLGNLPAGCIALILAYTSPWDVARLALVNRTFGEVSGCDLVWENMLPFNYSEVVSLAMNYRPLAPYNSKRDLYHLLCKQIFLQDGTEGYWLDRATGGVCCTISAKKFTIVRGDDARYWEWLPHNMESRSVNN